jgi:hypothetical protein
MDPTDPDPNAYPNRQHCAKHKNLRPQTRIRNTAAYQEYLVEIRPPVVAGNVQGALAELGGEVGAGAVLEQDLHGAHAPALHRPMQRRHQQQVPRIPLSAVLQIGR